jgi:hypothetical protein
MARWIVLTILVLCSGAWGASLDTLYLDNFEDGNYTAAAGPKGLSWTVLSGNAVVQHVNGVANTSYQLGIYLYQGSPMMVTNQLIDSSEFTVQFDGTVVWQEPGSIIVLYKDQNNYYSIGLGMRKGVYRKLNGVETQLYDDGGNLINLPNGYSTASFKVYVHNDGSAIQLKVDRSGDVNFGYDVELTDTSTAAAAKFTAGTKVGMMVTNDPNSYSSSQFFIDNVVIVDGLASISPPPPPTPHVYYIDWAGGSDTNDGLAKNSDGMGHGPWQRAPGMHGTVAGVGPGSLDIQNGTTCPNGCDNSGSSFIFKGGVTWPWQASDSTWWIHMYGTGPDAFSVYFGVDTTWYAGANWTRPIFDFGGPTGGQQLCNNLMGLQPAKYVVIDNFEFIGYYWDSSCNPLTQSIGYIFVGSAGHNELKNLYMHGFSHATNPLPNDMCGLINGGTGYVDTTSFAHDNVFDGSDFTAGFGNRACQAVWSKPITFYNNYCYEMLTCANGIANPRFYQNTCDHLGGSFNLQHDQCLQAAGSGLVYNNLMIWPQAGNGMITMGVGNTYFFNNVSVDDCGGKTCGVTPPIACGDNVHGQYGRNGGANCYVFNNTFYYQYQNGDGFASACLASTFYSWQTSYCEEKNNHWIGPAAPSASGNCVVDADHNCVASNNVGQTLATANAQGYAETYTQGSAYPFTPSNGSGATVGAGANLTSLCATVPQLCRTTPAGVGYNRTSHTVIAPNYSTIRTRPATGPWDVGAYQYNSVKIQTPNVERRTMEKEQLRIPSPVKVVLLKQYLQTHKDLAVYDLAGDQMGPNQIGRPGIYLIKEKSQKALNKVIIIQ